MCEEKTKGFSGTWRLDTSENFDEYMKAVEVGFMIRKLGAVAKPDVVIAIGDDGTWTVKSVTSFSSYEVKFKLGEKIDETTPDGRKVQTVFTLEEADKNEAGEGNGESGVKMGRYQLFQKQEGKVPSVITRQLINDGQGMICVCRAKDVKCTRSYKRHGD